MQCISKYEVRLTHISVVFSINATVRHEVCSFWDFPTKIMYAFLTSCFMFWALHPPWYKGITVLKKENTKQPQGLRDSRSWTTGTMGSWVRMQLGAQLYDHVYRCYVFPCGRNFWQAATRKMIKLLEDSVSELVLDWPRPENTWKGGVKIIKGPNWANADFKCSLPLSFLVLCSSHPLLAKYPLFLFHVVARSKSQSLYLGLCNQI